MDEEDQIDADEMMDTYDDCGMMSDGFCTLAGTEHCDFECPFSD